MRSTSVGLLLPLQTAQLRLHSGGHRGVRPLLLPLSSSCQLSLAPGRVSPATTEQAVFALLLPKDSTSSGGTEVWGGARSVIFNLFQGGGSWALWKHVGLCVNGEWAPQSFSGSWAT